MVLGVPIFKHFRVDKSSKMDLDLWDCLRREQNLIAELTYCILVDSSTNICWINLFVIFRVSGLFYHFYSFFKGKSC